MRRQLSRDDMLAELNRRLSNFTQTRDSSSIMSREARALNGRLRREVFGVPSGPAPYDADVILAVARYHWFRHQLLGDEEDEKDAMFFFTLLYARHPDAVPDALRPPLELVTELLIPRPEMVGEMLLGLSVRERLGPPKGPMSDPS